MKYRTPSLSLGLKIAARHLGLVAAVWVVGLVVSMPAAMVLEGAVGDALGRLPDGFEPPSGEIGLIVLEEMAGKGGPLAVAVASGLFLTWAFTILWHAGMARDLIWSAGNPPRISRLFGHGLGAWWKYCRLSLVALAAIFLLMTALWLPLGLAVESAYAPATESRIPILILIGLVIGPLIKTVVWTASLRGAWELAKPTSRSALAAWVRGFVGAFVKPLSSFGAVLTLGLGLAVAATLPVTLPILLPSLRGAFVGLLLGLASSLAASYFAVALFAAFAPVSGLMADGDEG